MAGKYITASIKPPRRVQITKVDSGSGYWKPGQFGYAISYSTHPGMFTMDKGPSAPGELSYMVSKSKDMRGGALWFSAEALRFTGQERAPSAVSASASASGDAHARKKKISPAEAKRLLQADGIDFSQDFHALPSYELHRIVDMAKMTGYRKRKDAPGSTARMYYQYLSRLPAHATRGGKHTVYDLVELNKRTKKERVLHEHFSTKEHANEAADEYRAYKRPDVTYRVRSRQVTAPPYRWNPED